MNRFVGIANPHEGSPKEKPMDKTILGTGILGTFGAEFLGVFWGFHLTERWNFHTDSCREFCRSADFCTDSMRRFLWVDFCADFWCTMRRFRADSPLIFLGRFGAWKIVVPEPCIIVHKVCRKICGVPTA